jgi:hypothetical protein
MQASEGFVSPLDRHILLKIIALISTVKRNHDVQPFSKHAQSNSFFEYYSLSSSMHLDPLIGEKKRLALSDSKKL